MTALKIEEKTKTILDFSGGKKCSKRAIKQAIQQCQINNILEEVDEKSSSLIVYRNEIKVGMYRVELLLLPDSPSHCTSLREHGDFEISIYDSESRIDLRKDGRFKEQYWVPYNFFGKLRIKHLIDVIAHCKRLDRLKAFL